MGSKLDMALDDIIKTNKSTRGAGRARGGGRPRGGSGGGGARGRGGSRGGARGGGGGAFRGSMSNGAGRSGVSAGRWNHDMYQGSAGSSRMMANSVGGPIKLCISNLDYGVTDSDIRELFQEFGDLRTAAVHYDRSGCSLGSAQVVFGRQTSAMNALKQYNGVHLDGRPMKIFIEGTAPIGSLMGAGPTGRPMVKRLNAGARPAPLMSGAGGRGGRGARGGGRGGRGGKAGEKTKPKTAEELDAELDNYLCEAKKTK